MGEAGIKWCLRVGGWRGSWLKKFSSHPLLEIFRFQFSSGLHFRKPSTYSSWQKMIWSPALLYKKNWYSTHFFNSNIRDLANTSLWKPSMLKKIVTALKGIVQYFITDYDVKMKGSLTFNSHEQPRWNFSKQYPHNIKQTSDKNKKRYQLPNSPNYNIIKIVQQTFSKENYLLHLGNEWVYW